MAVPLIPIVPVRQAYPSFDSRHPIVTWTDHPLTSIGLAPTTTRPDGHGPTDTTAPTLPSNENKPERLTRPGPIVIPIVPAQEAYLGSIVILSHPAQPTTRHPPRHPTADNRCDSSDDPPASPAERNEAYNTIMGYFSPASTPQSLLEQLLSLFEAQAVGALRIFVADALGASPQIGTWPPKAFGYLDDIEGEAGELILVDSDMLSQTTASRVLSLDHHMAELDAHQQRPSVPVIPEGTGHTELIRAHKAFFIPFELPWGSYIPS
eukprot:jgi/Psemu1/25775/gm1.25775_g